MLARFNPGKIVATQSVAEKIKTDPDFASFVRDSLQRHLAEDWGDLCEEDRKENEFSLKISSAFFQPTKRQIRKSGLLQRPIEAQLPYYFPRSIRKINKNITSPFNEKIRRQR